MKERWPIVLWGMSMALAFLLGGCGDDGISPTFPDTCLTDDDCGTDGVCVDGTCQAKVLCESDDDCTGEGEVCGEDGYCVLGCSSDDDCGDLMICEVSSGVCVMPEECEDNGDCTGGLVCLDGACGPCTMDRDCEDGKACGDDGRCGGPENTTPLADAGEALTARAGDEVTLDGSASADADGDDTLTYQWAQLSGPEDVEIQSADGAIATFTAPLTPGEYIFELTVTDEAGASSTATVTVTVENLPPVANAGANQVVSPLAEITLDGSASLDPEGEDITYTWTQISGPGVQLEGEDTPSPTFQAPGELAELVFSLIVNDGLQDSDADTVTVNVGNSPPVAEAGEPQSVLVGAAVTLDGSASSDPDGNDITYAWVQTSGEAVVLDDAASATPSFTAPAVAGDLIFDLVVNDGVADSEIDQVTITVTNGLPVAEAGEDQIVMVGETLTLDGTASSDPDGQDITYAWSQIEGNPVELEDATSATPSFTTPFLAGELVFELIVNDGFSDSEPDSVTITVGNGEPVADAGVNQAALVGTDVTLDGTASLDPDGQEITYLWAQLEGPAVTLDDPTSPTPLFTAPLEVADLVFELVVNDGFMDSYPDTVTVTVNNGEPLAVAGDDQNVLVGSEVTLDGSASNDPDGHDLTYTWTLVSEVEGVTLSDPTSPTPTFTAPVEPMELTFELIVNDGTQDSAPDQVTVVVYNTPPVANAGEDMTVFPGDEVILNGSGSDEDGQDLTYSWTVEGEVVELDDATIATPTFTAPVELGDIVLTLVVNDGYTDSEPDTIVVSVNNGAPVANAGSDQSAFPLETVTLDGSLSSDPDGQSLTYTWTLVTEVEGVELDDATSATPSFTTPLDVGELVFQLIVNDGYMDSAPDTVSVSVHNEIPVAEAGEDQSVLPGAVVTLSGSGTDGDGHDLTYTWSQVSGEAIVLDDPALEAPTFTAPAVLGDIVLQLIVNDGFIDSDPDTITITVYNGAPVADAGEPQSVRPLTAVTLDGSASTDPDGQALTYLWSQVSGSSVTMDDTTSVTPTFTAPVEAGDIVLQLMVNDGFADSEPALVTITVVNATPVANAGADFNDILPGASITLDGTASSDGDGDPITYLWTQTQGQDSPLDDNTSATPSLTVPEIIGNLVYELVVNDGFIDSEADTVYVNVGNAPPVAVAGEDRRVEAGSLVALDGSGSYDPDEGQTITYLWTQVSGTTVNLQFATTDTPEFTAPTRSGDLVFQLVVNDGYVGSEPDLVTVTILNSPPVANAGPDQSVNPGVMVTLDGTASWDTDEDPLTYSWVLFSGPQVTLGDPTSPTPTFTAPPQRGEIVFNLTVNDGRLDSDVDQVTITVLNVAPVADAGDDLLVAGGEVVTLDGSGSTDGNNDTLTYIWTQVQGDAVNIEQQGTAYPMFVAPIPKQELIFELVVNDGEQNSAPDRVSVRIQNHPPVADAGRDQSVVGGAVVQLHGEGSFDYDNDSLTYQWTQISGTNVTLSSNQVASPTFTTPLNRATLEFMLVVNDGTEDSAPAFVKVMIANGEPVADAGRNMAADPGSTVTLDGSNSYDPDGDDLTYTWSQISGTNVTLSSANVVNPSFTAPQNRGSLVFELVVNDGLTNSDPDTVVVSVDNTPPIARAGQDQVVEQRLVVTLDGSASSDADRDFLSYQWIQVEGPPVILSNDEGVVTTFTSPAMRTKLTFELIVNDGFVGSDPDLVTIHVDNNPPVALAGPDQNVQSGAAVILDGSASYDRDSDPITYHWRQISGTTVTLTNPTSARPTIIAPQGRNALIFELVVHDGITSSEPDITVVNVNNYPPVADAGLDQFANGGESITLDGTNSFDRDGDPLTYNWRQTGGIAVALDDPHSPTPSFTAPYIQEMLVFTLEVSDGAALSLPDEVRIHVDNEPPVARAGDDQVVTGGAEVALDGSRSSDPDGDAITYDWRQVSGPVVILSNPASPIPTFTAPADRAEVIFELVVADSWASSLPDQVTINVDNRPPVADAGPDQQVAGGAAVRLDGSDSFDPDEDPLSYHWTQISGALVSLSNPTAVNPSFTAPMGRAAYTFELVVFDGIVESPPDVVVINVGNIAPVADAGPDQEVAPSATVRLNGTSSFDDDGDPLTYWWRQVEGSLPAILDDPTSPTPTFVAPAARTLVAFELVVNDGVTNSDPDVVIIHVGNTPPVADAGSPLTVSGGAMVMLNGGGSFDADFDRLTYSWAQVSGPWVLLENPTTPNPTFTAPSERCTLVFELIVNDGLVDSVPSEVTISVGNAQPVARAGDDQLNVAHSTVVTLDGTRSFDPDNDPITYRWVQVEGDHQVQLSDPTASRPTFLSPPIKDTLVFELIVNDGFIDSTPDQVTIQNRNTAPIANAGLDQTVNGGVLVTLDGRGSSDADGDLLEYNWTQVGGTATVALSDPHVARPTFTAPVAHDTLVFELVVDDGTVLSAPDTMTVTISNHAPVADAGPNQTINPGAFITLDGSRSSDLDNDPLTYQWIQVSGPDVALSNDTAVQPTFTAPDIRSAMVFELIVNDGFVDSAPDQVTISVQNNPPVANAGPDQEVTSSQVVILDGTGSSDADGDPLTYSWRQVSGTGVLLNNHTSPTPSFTAPVARTDMVFELTVNDGIAPDTDTVTISIPNHAPVANAGQDQTINGGDRVQLDGSASADLDGDSLTYLWLQVEGAPVGLSNPTIANPTFTAPIPSDTLVFELTVNDGHGGEGRDLVAISIMNHPPVANAGNDQFVSPGFFVTLDGRGTDPDNDDLTYQWTQVAGPNVVLSDETIPRPTFHAPGVKSELIFELIVNDGIVDSEPDLVTVSVGNNPPTADAGEDQAVDGLTRVVLDGRGSDDVDGDPLIYSWLQVSGTPVALDDDSSPTPTFTAPHAKTTLVFELVVDDGTAQDMDSVTVLVNNNAPVANAGPDQNVEGDSTVVMDGTRSFDIDGDDLDFSWVQVSGPNVTLLAHTTPTPNFVAPAFKSALIFELIVNDGDLDSPPDRVTVSVANNPPVADAGEDQTVDPIEEITLDGSGSFDIDGDPLTYHWEQLEGPVVALNLTDPVHPVFTSPAGSANLVFELIVNDGTVDSVADTVTVMVQNTPPVANAGLDQQVQGGALVTLDGRASFDPDGDGLFYRWTQTGGTVVALSDPASPTPTFTAPLPKQVLTFQLVVNDGVVDSLPDAMTVRILNHPPVAVAGSDQHDVPGGSTVTLDGRGSWDTDGDFLSYTWRQVSGTIVNLSSTNVPQPTFTAPQQRGTLVFELTVNDGEANSAPDTVSIFIANNPPVANAGLDQDVMPGAAVSLDGRASSDLDGDHLTYRWRQTGGHIVTLNGQNSSTPTFTAPGFKSSLTFELIVNDGFADSAPDTVTINVGNTRPVANAGVNQDVANNVLVTLDGRGSFDVDGDPLTYSWTQIAGIMVALSNPTSSTPTFVSPNQATVLEFQLVVYDGTAFSLPDTVTVTVGNIAPVANAGPDQWVNGGTLVTLNGTASFDANGDPLTYRWTQVAGDVVVLSNTAASQPWFTAPIRRQTLTFALQVFDGFVWSLEDRVNINTNNNQPVANAGPNQTVDSGDFVQLDGRGSSDPDGDALSYQWRQTGGTPVSLSNTTASRPTFTAPYPGHQTLTFELIVNDGFTNSVADYVEIYINNNAPSADGRGDPRDVCPEDWFCLDATGSSDPDGDALSYFWEQTSGPNAVDCDPATWEYRCCEAPNIGAWDIRDMRFEVTVDDGHGGVDTDPATVTVWGTMWCWK